MLDPKGLKRSNFSPKDLWLPRYETLAIADYDYVNIFSFAVLGIKLWLKEDGDLYTDHTQYSFKSVHSKAHIYAKCCLLLAITLSAT